VVLFAQRLEVLDLLADYLEMKGVTFSSFGGERESASIERFSHSVWLNLNQFFSCFPN
jgi:SNF2 family DNA or RNA helicase